MKKKYILNLLLLVLFIALAAIIYSSKNKSNELARLSNTQANSIRSITIHHNKNTTRLTRQDDGHWQITHPISIAANDFRVSSILNLISAPVHNRYSSTDIDLTKIGLDKSDTSIKLDDETISFGITNPATRLRYIKKGDFVYTIEDVYYPLLSSSFGTLVSLSLLPTDSEITKLILTNQTISKDKKGLWQSNIDISADDINKTIDHWQHDQAFGIHQYMKRDSLGEVFIYIKGQPPVRYLITDTDPWLILARPELGLEYHLDIEAYKNLITPQ